MTFIHSNIDAPDADITEQKQHEAKKLVDFDLRNMTIESEISELEMPSQKKFENPSERKIDLNNMNMVSSITDFSRRTSLHADLFQKKTQTSIENMDLITFAQMTTFGKTEPSYQQPLFSPKIVSPRGSVKHNTTSPTLNSPTEFVFPKTDSLDMVKHTSGGRRDTVNTLNLEQINEVVENSTLPDYLNRSKSNPSGFVKSIAKG